MNKKTIFVMLPSLMDDQIFSTVIDAINKADCPERISFGISTQGLGLESINELQSLSEVRACVLPKDIVYGIGATRSFLYGLYNSEDYILSLDCHSSFAVGWDSLLIEKHSELPNPQKAIITQPLSDELLSAAHIAEYGDPTLSEYPEVWRSHHAMQYLRISGTLSDSDFLKKNYVTPHFIFAPGSVVSLGYPKNYVFGEEGVLLSLLFFCHGYDTYMTKKTYVTTMPKDQESIRLRSKFFTDLFPHAPDYRLEDKLGYADSIEYPKPRALANHLAQISDLKFIYQEIEKQYIHLILFGYNDEIDLRNLDRTIDEFLDFHNTKELTKNRLSKKLSSY